MVLLEEIEALYNNFTREVYTPRILDAKTKELIAFSNSVIVDCKHCMKAHYKRAIKVGASQEEIAEAVSIAMTVSAGKMRGIARDIITELEKE